MRELGPGLFCGLAASLGRGSLQQNTLGMLSTELGLPTFEGEEGRAETQSPLGYWNSVGTVGQVHSCSRWDTPPKRLKPGLAHWLN